MRHSLLNILGFFFAIAPGILSSGHLHSRHLRRSAHHKHGHVHKRDGEDINAADIDADVNINSTNIDASLRAKHKHKPKLHFWALTDSFRGYDFYNEFDFEAIDDPTRGRVNYVNMSTAIAKGLTEAKWNSFILRADSTSVLDPNGPGRDSIRIQSKKQWTTGVTILNLVIRASCCRLGSKANELGTSTEPYAYRMRDLAIVSLYLRPSAINTEQIWSQSYWMTQTEDWPIHGELDVIEGVNDQPPNFSALHTLNGCTVAPQRTMTGSVVSTNCSYLNNWNQGCPVQWDRPEAYGSGLNKMGGGWFVTERTESKISIWFWGRKDENVPPAVKYGFPIVSTTNFGTPVAVWESSDTCDFKKIFGSINIIINLTFCELSSPYAPNIRLKHPIGGEWAGQTPLFNAAGCPGTCVDYVNNNPNAFKDAYWDIASINVYSRAI